LCLSGLIFFYPMVIIGFFDGSGFGDFV
jgi:hypothetical protein